MTDYMMEAVGDATSECEVKKEQFAIVFHGEYDPNAKPLPPFTTLANVISNFEEPDLGGYKCSKEITKKDGRISIKLEYKGKYYKTACVGIINYLNQSNFSVCRLLSSDDLIILHVDNFLDRARTRTKCGEFNEGKTVVYLWSDE